MSYDSHRRSLLLNRTIKMLQQDHRKTINVDNKVDCGYFKKFYHTRHMLLTKKLNRYVWCKDIRGLHA